MVQETYAAPRPRPAAPARGDASIGVSPDEMSVSLGGLRFDLGAGHAPYDDGIPSNDLHFWKPEGFSDSLLRVSFEQPLLPWASLTGTASATRFQEEMLLDAVLGAEVAWFTIGIHIRF